MCDLQNKSVQVLRSHTFIDVVNIVNTGQTEGAERCVKVMFSSISSRAEEVEG